VPEELDHIPPTYREIADLLRADMDSGLYPRGTWLPSASELAARYQVGRTTIARAMALLEASGDIQGAQGRGRLVLRG